MVQLHMVYVRSRHVQLGKDILVKWKGFKALKKERNGKMSNLNKVERLEKTKNMLVSLTVMIFAINQFTTKSSIISYSPIRYLKEHCY